MFTLYIYHTCIILLSINSRKRLPKSYAQKRLSFANGNVYKSSSQNVSFYYCREINFALFKLYSKHVCEVDKEPPGVGRDRPPRKKQIQIPGGMPWGYHA